MARLADRVKRWGRRADATSFVLKRRARSRSQSNEGGDAGPHESGRGTHRPSIDFEDGTTFTATLHARNVLEWKLTCGEAAHPLSFIRASPRQHVPPDRFSGQNWRLIRLGRFPTGDWGRPTPPALQFERSAITGSNAAPRAGGYTRAIGRR
jgi:hypothetical protein